MSHTSDLIVDVEEVMEVGSYHVKLPTPIGAAGHHHRHVAIEWEGGVIWLDMSEQSDHYCVDVRQFVAAANADGVELAGQGVFGMVNGRRQALAEEVVPGTKAATEPLKDPDGTPVKGHGWNASYVVTLMHDKVPSNKQTNRPAAPGRG